MLKQSLRLFYIIALISCGTGEISNENISTKVDREALFQEILETTIQSEAFSEIKQSNLEFNAVEAMMNCKADIVDASNDTELYFALQKLSCARKDRHLSIEVVEEGLVLDEYPDLKAPIQFKVDFSEDGNYFLFVSNITEEASMNSEAHPINIGDRLVGINGMLFQDYFDRASAYYRYSNLKNLWIRFASIISTKEHDLLPPNFYKERFDITLVDLNGNQYQRSLDYLPKEKKFEWQLTNLKEYSGYVKIFETTCYHLYLPTDPKENTVLLWWYGFRSSIDEDMQRLMDYAKENQLLGRNVIVDLMDSRGGSRGASMITRLTSKPYKTTFGNIRLSEMCMEFVKNKLEIPYKEFVQVLDGDSKEGDNAKWVLDWIAEDVYPRYQAGEDYSSNVPFKCAHAPYDSDGILQPADIHFTGEMVCFFSPWGGSHLDQFAHIIADNNLAYTIGMQTGGYSNTWEVEKILNFPISKKPVVQYMWSIGHTISPNGEIAEGNPAPIDKSIPISKENFRDYRNTLLEEAHSYFEIIKD